MKLLSMLCVKASLLWNCHPELVEGGFGVRPIHQQLSDFPTEKTL